MQETAAARASAEGHVTLAQATRDVRFSLGSTSSGPVTRSLPLWVSKSSSERKGIGLLP